MAREYHFNFFVDTERMVIIIRPIGYMPGPYFVEKLFEAYRKLDAPWRFSRINDFRRFDGHFSQDDLDAIAQGWKEIADGQPYSANVAVVSQDPLARLRISAVSPQFPNETICVFSDYHEAMGWVLANDQTAYLAGLGALTQRRGQESDIIVE